MKPFHRSFCCHCPLFWLHTGLQGIHLEAFTETRRRPTTSVAVTTTDPSEALLMAHVSGKGSSLGTPGRFLELHPRMDMAHEAPLLQDVMVLLTATENWKGLEYGTYCQIASICYLISDVKSPILLPARRFRVMCWTCHRSFNHHSSVVHPDGLTTKILYIACISGPDPNDWDFSVAKWFALTLVAKQNTQLDDEKGKYVFPSNAGFPLKWSLQPIQWSVELEFQAMFQTALDTLGSKWLSSTKFQL